MIALPGDPRGVWERAAGQPIPERWLPSPEDLPPWDTLEELDAHYSAIPFWWQRWFVPFLTAFLAVIAAVSMLPAIFEVSVRGTIAQVVMLASGVVVLVVAVVFALREVRLRAQRTEHLQACFDMLQTTAVPVWAVLEDRVRVSGGGDTVYDLQFVFDLRAPRETLALQRHVVEVWLDAIAGTFDSDDPVHLPEGFARGAPVPAAEVFGEGMRGVWIWEKGAIYPIQVLGLALDDPRTTDALSDVNVVFRRDQPKDLRRASKIARSDGGS